MESVYYLDEMRRAGQREIEKYAREAWKFSQVTEERYTKNTSAATLVVQKDRLLIKQS
ncbi:hypothetical protein [Aneurinibacillus sp. REN35]|uniref:hypothetical protein n=1 Tax=Aneurinibacillus sp. REN35 TaxID=3237286 RepID=UPI003528DABD